jgi:hypothetical protein
MAVGEMDDETKDRSEDMTRFDRLFATAILSGVLAAGGGMGIAAAHHGEPGDHSTTKGKTLSEIEMRERQITAELNRKQLEGPQVAMATPASPSGMPAAMPAMPNDEEAALADESPELAAVEDAAN